MFRHEQFSGLKMYRSKNSTILILLDFMTKTENHRHKKTYLNMTIVNLSAIIYYDAISKDRYVSKNHLFTQGKYCAS